MYNSVVFARFALTTIFRSDMLPNLPNRTNTSVLACANLCGYGPTCKSFLHDFRDGRCFLKDIYLQDEKYVSTKPGVKYYRKPLPECSVSGFTYVADGNFCYRDYMKENENMDYAKTICRSLGAMLMMANSEAKHRFITNIGRQHGYKYQWIGGKKDNSWRWLDGKPFGKSYWREGGTDPWLWNNCVHYLWSDGVYSWDDDKCSVKAGFMCEAPVKD